MKAERRKPILIVQHAEHEHPAALRRALEGQGIQTHWIHPYQGEAYPTVSEISGMISLGGPMGANDIAENPWIEPECRLLRQCVETERPTVGICLGGQLMAKALGGRVEKHTEPEIGWHPIQVNAHAAMDPVLGAAGSSPLVYHWHHDTFFLPPGAVPLAESRLCARQAYRIGDHAYGFQFHPEADHQLVTEWLSIEGVEDEILREEARFGSEFVQIAKIQRKMALRGEASSVRIIAAIGALFRQREIRVPRKNLSTQARKFHQEKTLILLEFEGSDRRPHHLRGRVSELIESDQGEFLIFQEENLLLWPLRLGDVLSLKKTDSGEK